MIFFLLLILQGHTLAFISLVGLNQPYGCKKNQIKSKMVPLKLSNVHDSIEHPHLLSSFDASLQSLGITDNSRKDIINKLELAGWQSSEELYHFASDFFNRPEVLSDILKNDFGFSVLEAHKCRAALTKLQIEDNESNLKEIMSKDTVFAPMNSTVAESGSEMGINFDSWIASQVPVLVPNESKDFFCGKLERDVESEKDKCKSKGVYKDIKVKNMDAIENEKYGLPATDFKELYPVLSSELEDFYQFMTEPHPLSQETPIRKTTADVYMRHARLFLGWYVKTHYVAKTEDSLTLSLTSSFKSSNRESVKPIFDFLQWLRKSRGISVSYEANMLRGIIKLAKFRFATESNTDTSYGGKSFEDIPLIREMRKLHRDANRRQSVAPRVSDETAKWLTWPEYLVVVDTMKNDLIKSIANFKETYGPGSDFQKRKVILHERKKLRQSSDARGLISTRQLRSRPPLDLDWKSRARKSSQRSATTTTTTTNNNNNNRLSQRILTSNQLHGEKQEIENEDKESAASSSTTSTDSSVGAKRMIARMFQSYLVLALFACIPDRQRTFRELTLGRTLIKEVGTWMIRHGPDDYKTGTTYGARPPLVIAPDVGLFIDEFITHYRPLLNPSGEHLFVQPRTGKPLTQDSVYAIVARNCYNYAGKRTNPHLLRDMIVTHVRETDASEKELEALALYMGHSINMQRNSYDRRTLDQKVAPAVSLLQNLNKLK
jgi:hypothetical protein